MLGKMQDWPLLVSRLIDHAGREHSQREVVTNQTEGGLCRFTWADILHRSKQLAQGLERLGLAPGDRIATLGWNTHRHLECWFGVAGAGMICHTINPRLFIDQISYIINHADDRVLLFDISFTPLVQNLLPRLTGIKHLIALTDAPHTPRIEGHPVIAYEDLLAAEDGDYGWKPLDENTPCSLCYTSGTTGNPKGVLYSHRSTVLHTYAACLQDTLGVASSSVMMPVVPMFHSNAWGVPYAAAAVGAKLVLNGPAFDSKTLYDLITQEKVSTTAAVPTVWLAMLNYLDTHGLRFDSLESVVIGGSAAPRMMIERFQTHYGVKVHHAWGMTELSPLGTVGTLSAAALAQSPSEQLDIQCKQGRAIFGVEIKITDSQGRSLPRDGQAFGHLKVRGPWVVGQYFQHDADNILDADGYFDTGDIATIDPLGYVHITDRAKDVIKSGGEWISSIEIENSAVAHPGVAEAAVIGVAHPKWDERPLLIIVKKADATVSKSDMLDFIAPSIAKWWLPEDVQFVDSMPHTATGKVDKRALRALFRDYTLPNTAS